MNFLLALNLYSNPGFTEEGAGSTGSKTPIGIAESLFKNLLMKENASASPIQTAASAFGTAGNLQGTSRSEGKGQSIGTKETLEAALFGGSGSLAGMIKLPPEAGEKLMTLLQSHGLSQKQSSALIKTATDKAGFIHLDRLIARLGQTKAAVANDQTSLIIASRDVPQFQEVLFKMGLGVAQVKSLAENCDDGAGNMLLNKVCSELPGQLSAAGSPITLAQPISQKTLVHLLSEFGIQCKPEKVSQTIDSKELVPLMKDYAATSSEDAQADIKSTLADILEKKGVAPQKVKSFLEGMTVEYAKSVARTKTAENQQPTTAAEVGLWNGIVLKPQRGTKEDPWTEKILSILKDSPKGTQKDIGNTPQTQEKNLTQDKNLQPLVSQLTEKEDAGGKTVTGKTASVLTSGEAREAVKDLLKTTAEKSEQGQSNFAATLVPGSTDPDAGSGKVQTATQGAETPNPVLVDHTLNTSSVSKVLNRMQWMVEAGQQKARIQLSPPDLGHIDIQLVIDQGHLRASLGTESMHVKEMIQSNLGQLKQQLSQMGFAVDEFNVHVGMDNRRSRDGEEQWGRKARVGAMKAARKRTQTAPILQGTSPVRTPANTDYQVSVRV